MPAPHRYFIVYKPYGVLSQFTREHPTHRVLGDMGQFPSDVYPVGRLDKDSEGLLLLTNDSSLNHRLLHPSFRHSRTYWVQVEGDPQREDLLPLSNGVSIRINKKNYQTLPAKAELLPTPPALPERDPPIRFRKQVPDRWLSLTLHEGKNRQVRRMCAAIGYPVLRLVRAQIADLTVKGMKVGEIKELSEERIYRLLGL